MLTSEAGSRENQINDGGDHFEKETRKDGGQAGKLIILQVFGVSDYCFHISFSRCLVSPTIASIYHSPGVWCLRLLLPYIILQVFGVTDYCFHISFSRCLVSQTIASIYHSPGVWCLRLLLPYIILQVFGVSDYCFHISFSRCLVSQTIASIYHSWKQSTAIFNFSFFPFLLSLSVYLPVCLSPN